MSHQKGQISGIHALDAFLPAFRTIGSSGFILAHNFTFWGPEYFHSEYPKAWQVEYEGKGYAYFDPILLWCITGTGDRRWSDVKMLDLRGVMKAARKFGLNHGAAFSRTRNGKRSILTAGRADRDLTDDEMAFLAAAFESILDQMENGSDGALTAAETETLRCLRDGMSYAEAAGLLEVSVPAIKARIEKIRGKLGARNATQAVALAIRRKLI